MFCMSSHGVNICVKLHENMSSGFKVMEKTQKLLRDTHTQKKENYIPHCMHTWYAGRGYNQSYDSCVLHVVLWLKICVKFHENMSSGLKVMKQTQNWLTHKGQ